jgi:hypothetical protein
MIVRMVTNPGTQLVVMETGEAVASAAVLVPGCKIAHSA